MGNFLATALLFLSLSLITRGIWLIARRGPEVPRLEDDSAGALRAKGVVNTAHDVPDLATDSCSSGLVAIWESDPGVAAGAANE